MYLFPCFMMIAHGIEYLNAIVIVSLFFTNLAGSMYENLSAKESSLQLRTLINALLVLYF